MKELPPQIEKEEPKKGLSSKETYNAVSDTVVGVNVRKKDNIFHGM